MQSKRAPMLVLAAMMLTDTPVMHAQGVSTSAIRAVVRVPPEVSTEVIVTVRNVATGFSLQRATYKGTVLIDGLEPGGPYSISVQQTGLVSQRIDAVHLRLGDVAELVFIVEAAPVELDTLSVAAIQRVTSDGGIATTLGDSLLHNLPSLNRDLYDFVRLVPQVSTTIGFSPGMSGGGVGFRFNNFLINGVAERTVFANATAALSGGRSLPLDAVKEYQVLLTPFDVRYGDFAGALVNTITKAGTNDFDASAFAFFRTDDLARSGVSATPYERYQVGISAGGPIIRDRLHFFIASELQRQSNPAAGPFLSNTPRSAPVRAEDIAQLTAVMATYGLEAGSAGRVENRNPLTNIFARVDLGVPELSSRAVIWTNYGRARDDRFARRAGDDEFSLSTLQWESSSRHSIYALQVHTTLQRSGGGHNELLVAYDDRNFTSTADVRQPIIRVLMPGAAGGTVLVTTGTNAAAHGVYNEPRVIQLSDYLTLPIGRTHIFTAGVSAEFFHIGRGGLMGSYGTWTFSSIDALARREAEAYELRKDFGSATFPADGKQFAAYVMDRWRPTDGLTITAGLRADRLSMDDRAPYNEEVDSIFGRRTDATPRPMIHLSPRVGFAWDVPGKGQDQLSGGVGVFSGRPPIAWLHSSLISYGVGTGRLTCRAGTAPSPPAFEPDYRQPPEACASGLSIRARPNGEVNLLDPGLRMAQTLRGSLAYERRLAFAITATAEVLVTRSLSDFLFVNLNLAGPRGAGHNGRIMYGALDSAGAVVPGVGRRSNFAEVIDLKNTARNHSLQLTMRMDKDFAGGSAAIWSYTHTRARDVQTPLRTGTLGIVNWSARAISTSHENLEPETSLNDVPHRVIVGGTYPLRRGAWGTHLSFYYIGESGTPFTYIVSDTASARGDLNADGSDLNDPVYVPVNAFDPSEIRFQSPEQGAAFNTFIEQTPCLRSQRGRIIARNSCREPWFNTSVAALRQSIPVGDRSVAVQFEVYNLLNLINGRWGQRRMAIPELLKHVGQYLGGTQPVFTYARQKHWQMAHPESDYQLQLSLRYRF